MQSVVCAVVAVLDADYILAQLKAFRSGDRVNDAGKMMRTIASKMSDQEMLAVANYVSGLK